uniref:Aminopeptidase n=1 Tax=Leptinotarsa decemlineata TaxID=7539 RepID=D9J2F6_LEPDE|nr:aminopeptidase N [Leptinotarsa decemlineata]
MVEMAWVNTVALYLVLLCIVSAEISVRVAKDHRLPKTVVPLHYILRIHINDIESNNFTGSVAITFQTSEATNTILLHASPDHLHLSKIILNSDFEKPCNVTNADKETEKITITCSENTDPKDENSLVINYEALLSDDGEFGLYKNIYEQDGHQEVLLATQMVPSYARRVFPCFDEPEFKAVFDIFILFPDTFRVVGNTQIRSISNESNGLDEVEFGSTPPMPTYLIGFVLSKLESGNSLYKVYTRPQLKPFTGTALKYTPNIIQLMSDWAGVEYKDMKNAQLDQVVLEHSTFRSRENWGLIIYREQDLLDEVDKSTEITKQKIISNIAHSVSKQWFGAYVTPDWWSDEWLSEGFATFFEYFLPGQIPDLKFEYEKQFTINELQVALREDAFPDSEPLSSKEEDVMTSDDCLKKFNAVTSKKGASLIRMMRSIKGDDEFQNCIKSYLSANQFNITDPKSLLKVLDLENRMVNWIYESGYPLLTVRLNNNQQKVIVAQEKFEMTKKDTANRTSWNVPVTFATSEDKSFSVKNVVWLEPNNDLIIGLEGESWIILNNQQTGFYRVNYDDILWSRIIKTLKGGDMKNIHVLNRAQLIDDAFNVARAGKVNYITVFSLADYLKGETEYYPWFSALNAVSYLVDHINDNETTIVLNRRILQWINAAFPNLKKVESTDHVGILKETLILKWKCELKHEDCLKYTSSNFESFKTTRSILNNEERNLILCYGIRNSKNPQIDYNFLLHVFQNTNSTCERESILTSLGCISEPKVLFNYLLELVTDHSIIPHSYASLVFEAVYSNKASGVDVTLDFLLQNIELLMEKHRRTFSISDFIIGLTDKIKTEEQLKKLQNIVTNNPNLDDLSLVGGKMITRIKYNLEWTEMYTEVIKEALPKTSNAVGAQSNTFVFTSACVLSCVYLYLLK